MGQKSKLEEFAALAGKTKMQFFCEAFYKHGSQAEMAKALGISPSTINRWMLELGLIERNVLAQASSGLRLTEKGQLAILRERK